MTERAFRDPSPSRPDRPASSHGPYPRYDNEAPPPVPALPKNIAATPPVPKKSSRRPASVEPPERLNSPPPPLPGGRGVSLDRGPGTKAGRGGASAGKTSLESVGELDRSGARGSVNFSRPMSPQNSPNASELPGKRVSSPLPGPASATGLSNRETERSMGSLQETASRPVKKKKKVVAKSFAEGSHLAVGTSGGPPQEIAPGASPQPGSLTPSPMSTGTQPSGGVESPWPKMKKKKKAAPSAHSLNRDPEEGFGNAYPSDTDSVISERSTTTERPRSFATRAAGMLAKQPSIVREEREAEERAEPTVPGKLGNGTVASNGNAGQGTPANTSKVVSKPHSQPTGQTSVPQAKKNLSTLGTPVITRPMSLSPARAAHFSSQPSYETPDGTKHQPPARSVSPAKSALKHSPSRGHSPALSRNQGLSPSEASDTASDASGSAARKKKAVRVSFDEGSVAVGRAASPPIASADSPILMSPQSKGKPRSWLDLIRDNKVEQDNQSEEQFSIIKPTPTLPSFGSVRGRPDDATSQPTGNATSSAELAQDNMRSVDTSSDQKLGGLISQEAEKRERTTNTPSVSQRLANDPLPPDVTSVEGSGYHSDDGEILDEQPNQILPRETESLEGSSKTMASLVPNLIEEPQTQPPSGEQSGPVPSIALLPATPGVDEGLMARNEWLGMPGEFPSAAEAAKREQSHASPETGHPSPVINPATVGIAEPEPEAAAAQHDIATPAVGEVAESLRTQIESHSGGESEDDTTGGSVYSDAAEDQSDGDGFGSINAIVESPASPNFALSGRSPPASPSEKGTIRPSQLSTKQNEPPEPSSTEGWDRAQAYWSGLSQTRKQQLEQAALPGAVDEAPVSNKTMRGADSVAKRKKKKKTSPLPSGSNNEHLPPWPDKQYQKDVTGTASTIVPKMNSSMRASQTNRTEEPHMRLSMRDGQPAKPSLRNSTQRNSVQGSREPKNILQKKTRPVSAVAMVDYNEHPTASTPNNARAASVNKGGPSLAPVSAQQKNATPAPAPKVRRVKSNGSDSSSSFKKARPSASDTGRYPMKRSMRPSQEDGGSKFASANQASSLSARTSSPAGSVTRRPFSSMGPRGMRTSMRSSMDSAKPARMSLREPMDSNKANRTKSPSRFGFGKSSKSKPTESKPASRYSNSRFGDSSDDDDGLPTMSSSRFADSSDDDEPAPLAPVRGIPRRIDEGDSTDLEDSDENNAAPTDRKTPAPATITQPPGNTKPEGLALATGSLRAPSSGQDPLAPMGSGLHAKMAAEKKKRSFFAVLSGNKRDDSSTVRKPDIESAARRNTPLERTKGERPLTSNTRKADQRVLTPSPQSAGPGSPKVVTPSVTGSTATSPKSPKLQRRNTPKGVMSATGVSWPLPQRPGGSTAPSSRPRTSDGPTVHNAGGRPDIGLRRSTVEGQQGSAVTATTGRSGKKKKFPMLRKAFGLHD